MYSKHFITMRIHMNNKSIDRKTKRKKTKNAKQENL